MLPPRIEPKPGQESVWDYPRPPRVESSPKLIQIYFNGVMIVESRQTQRVLETSHPPVYYIPPQDLKIDCLRPSKRQSYCEWKGMAGYYSVSVGEQTAIDAAWYYPEPTHAFEAIKNYVAFYPSKMEACYLNGELVAAQPGDFYGGWITSEIVGPFKGGVGSWGC